LWWTASTVLQDFPHANRSTLGIPINMTIDPRNRVDDSRAHDLRTYKVAGKDEAARKDGQGGPTVNDGSDGSSSPSAEKSSVSPQHDEYGDSWEVLCERAAGEQDPEKLLALVREINRLLDSREKQLSGDGSTRPGQADGFGRKVP
jgi:hypothetical protein